MKTFKQFLLEKESPFSLSMGDPSTSNYDLDPQYKNLQVSNLTGSNYLFGLPNGDYVPGVGNLSMWWAPPRPNQGTPIDAQTFWTTWNRMWMGLAQNWFTTPENIRYERYNELVRLYFERLGPDLHPSYPGWPNSIAIGYTKDGQPICQTGECYSERNFPPNLTYFNPYEDMCPPNCPTSDGRVSRNPIDSYVGGPATQGGMP